MRRSLVEEETVPTRVQRNLYKDTTDDLLNPPKMGLRVGSPIFVLVETSKVSIETWVGRGWTWAQEDSTRDRVTLSTREVETKWSSPDLVVGPRVRVGSLPTHEVSVPRPGKSRRHCRVPESPVLIDHPNPSFRSGPSELRTRTTFSPP